MEEGARSSSRGSFFVGNETKREETAQQRGKPKDPYPISHIPYYPVCIQPSDNTQHTIQHTMETMKRNGRAMQCNEIK